MVIYNWPSIAFFVIFYAVSITAIVITVLDKNLSVAKKFIWVALIVIVPVLGVVAWAIYRLSKRLTRRTTTP